MKLIERTKKIEKLQLKLKTIRTILQKKDKKTRNQISNLLNKLKYEKSKDDQREQDFNALMIHLAAIEKEYNDKTKMILSSLNLEQNQCDLIESELKSVHQTMNSLSHLNVTLDSNGDREIESLTNKTNEETYKSTIKALYITQNEFIKEIIRYQTYIKQQNHEQYAKSSEIENLNKQCKSIQMQLEKRIKTVAHKNRVIAKLEALILDECEKMSDIRWQLQMKLKKLEDIVVKQEQLILSLNVQLTEATAEIKQQIETISMQKRVLRLRGEHILSMQHNKVINK